MSGQGRILQRLFWSGGSPKAPPVNINGGFEDFRVLTIWLFIVDFCCFNASNSEFSFLAVTLYSSILVRLSVYSRVSLVPLRDERETAPAVARFRHFDIVAAQQAGR